MKNREDIAIITVLYNPSSDDLEFVKGISSVYNGVIVDNSSHHNFKDQQIGKMTYIPLLKNTGIAHAQNVAIKYIIENHEEFDAFRQELEYSSDIKLGEKDLIALSYNKSSPKKNKEDEDDD